VDTYLSSDPHLDRKGNNTLNRPFSTVEEMSETIVDEYNSRVKRNDRLIIAGDFSFRDAAYWRQKIRCRHITLILGNHDRRQVSIQVFGEKNVREQYDTKCCGHPMWISHYPTLYWPKSHYGSFHGYGHVHDMRTDTIERLFPAYPKPLQWMPSFANRLLGPLSFGPAIRSLDLGPDCAHRLMGKWTCFSEQEVYDILISRPGHDNVEFYRKRHGAYKKDHCTEELKEPSS
jgi:calcineurin-like phosphoesterase family protein